VLARFERMRGRDVLWQPGTDHAGIATQMVVERQMMERQEPNRRALGREKFLEKVWAWKKESGGTITNQLKRLGASCDWSRERFTMDEGLSRAVLKVFVELYREGLIYKDKRLVNWDPKLLTAISDLEVQQVEVKGHLWYIRYPLEGATFNGNDPATFITVATTRPETMLGDVAVAVHPDDERYKTFLGKNAILPLVGRAIPIIADKYSDPKKGSGAVKITPAHDFNDFEVWQRHKDTELSTYKPINIFDPEARLLLSPNLDFKRHVIDQFILQVDQTIADLNGEDRFIARKRIVTALEDLDLVEKVETHTHMVPHGDRSGVVVEPFLTDQWYVDAKKLAVKAMAAVRLGRTVFVPQNWENTYFEWMENIQPWCISRQIWWGHRIPAWYGWATDGELISISKLQTFVAEAEEDAIDLARRHYKKDVIVVQNADEAAELIEFGSKRSPDKFGIWRDEDVLDTWFSSALWPFSTLGWPDDTWELKRFYPTDVLVTGFDIIFFWVARMMMMGLHFMKDDKGRPVEPFHTVYIHALVRDAQGAKMSKSKGNVIDPLHLIDDYGADALRFTLAAMAAQGRDIKLSTQRVEGYRNFATKLWNACRFAEMNDATMVADFDPRLATVQVNKWVAHWLANTEGDVRSGLESYKFNEAAGALYRFVWNVYCDWYLELVKPILTGPDGAAKTETRGMVAYVRDEILKMLHPFMPFITEELWRVTAENGARRQLLALSDWPDLSDLVDRRESIIDVVIKAVSEVRAIRTECNIDLKNITFVELKDFNDDNMAAFDAMLPNVARLVGAAVKLVHSDGKISEASRPRRPIDPAVVTESTDVPWSPDEVPINPKAVVGDIVVRTPIKEGSMAISVRAFDLEKERARLEKALAKVDADIKRVDAKLGNPEFVRKAPEEIIEGEREKREEAEQRRAKINEALERLKGAA
jgi:valyl-tRNA synthetase